jgi:hypothetical protein
VDIDAMQKQCLTSGIKAIHEQVASYDRLTYSCKIKDERYDKWKDTSFECRLLLKGALVEQLADTGLYHNPPIASDRYILTGKSHQQLCDLVSALRVPVWWSESWSKHKCDYSVLQAKLKNAPTRLQLEDYISAD